ncbi:MAG: hypothetical protein MH321_14815 [Leptospiraceae bacterium]|nr:hypothetical protein [Leptospiraceae bacterium]
MDESLEEKIPSSIERTLRKGNINFDFLQPEDSKHAKSESTASNRRAGSRQGKRGLFNRGRPARPFKKSHLIATILFCITQIIAFISICLSSNFIWLLFIPIVLTLFLGSLIMVTILLVRPL